MRTLDLADERCLGIDDGDLRLLGGASRLTIACPNAASVVVFPHSWRPKTSMLGTIRAGQRHRLQRTFADRKRDVQRVGRLGGVGERGDNLAELNPLGQSRQPLQPAGAGQVGDQRADLARAPLVRRWPR